MTMDQGTQMDHGSDHGGEQDRLQQAAGQVAEHVTDTAQHQLGTRVDTGLARAGDMLDQVASAVRRSGEQMRDQQPQVADIAETAAQQVDRASRFLHETDMNGLIREAEGFARQQPAVFIGGALALGLIASRLLKASPQGHGASFRSGMSQGYAGRGGYDRWTSGGSTYARTGRAEGVAWDGSASTAGTAADWSEGEHGGI